MRSERERQLHERIDLIKLSKGTICHDRKVYSGTSIKHEPLCNEVRWCNERYSLPYQNKK